MQSDSSLSWWGVGIVAFVTVVVGSGLLALLFFFALYLAQR